LHPSERERERERESIAMSTISLLQLIKASVWVEFGGERERA